MHPIQIGTTGWSYDDWLGKVYPDGTAKRDYLEHYARRFPAVEVDSSFYGVPRAAYVANWAKATPAAFRFALKMPREITHERVLVDCGETVDKLLAAVEPLGEKLLGVLLQFGYFNRTKFRSAAPFFERLDAFLTQYAPHVPLVCEIRNKSWLTGDYFDLLRRHRVVAALVEQAWLPPIERVVEQHDVLTGPFCYVRLIGDRKGIEEITRQWDEVVIDRGADLRRVAAVIRQVAEQTSVYAFVNNHYSGHAPATCAALAEAW